MNDLEKIVGYVRRLLDEQKDLNSRVVSLEESKQGTATRAEFGPGNPIARQEYTAQVRVSTVLPGTDLYYAKRLMTDATSFWTIDNSLSAIVVRVDPAETMPSSGDTQSVHYLGEPLDGNNDPVTVYRQASEPARVTQYRIKTVSGDYVTASTWINSVEGPTRTILKPWQLRRTPFDGATVGTVTYSYTSDVSRFATDGTDDENQVVVPVYRVDDVFYASPVRGTGVSVSGNEVLWLDINVDGRAWAKDDS